MSFAIKNVSKFAESPKGDWFNLHFTSINDDERESLSEKFEEMGFESTSRLTRDAGFVRVAHKTLKTEDQISALLKENGITILS